MENKNVLLYLQDSEARIILGSFHEDSARHVFCEVSMWRQHSISVL